MTDRLTISIVLVALAVLAIGTLLGGIYLTAIDKSLPGELIAIGSSAAGAIGSILAKTSSGPQEVQVVNAPAEPVPVADAGAV